MVARWPSFTVALLTSIVGLFIALDPHTWVTPAVGWTGVALVVVGGGLALLAAIRGSRPITRVVAVAVASVPAAVLLLFIALLFVRGD